MISKNKIIWLVAAIIIIGGIAYAGIGIFEYVQFKRDFAKAAEAAGGFPYQIGLTNAIIIQCFTTGIPPLCTGGTLCNLKDAATCANYSDVSGTPAGGMGSNALFMNTAILQAGLAAGGQLIAGGMSAALMDNGVLASTGGCYGCAAKAGKTGSIYAFFERLNSFIIAGRK